MSAIEIAKGIAISMYKNEPCRICGKEIGSDNNAVYANYSACNKSRAAHGVCWSNRPKKEDWAFPVDD